MGKRLLALAAALLALVQLPASASDVDIRLERAPLYQVTRLVLGELLHEPYVVDGALIAAEDVATIDVRQLTPDAARPLLETLLRSRGFVLERQGAITYVKRIAKPAEPERVFVYHPKYRSV